MEDPPLCYCSKQNLSVQAERSSTGRFSLKSHRQCHLRDESKYPDGKQQNQEKWSLGYYHRYSKDDHPEGGDDAAPD